MTRAFDDAQSARVRAALLQAARRSVATVGMRRSRVEDWAREAGISKGAFYRFFDSKEALLVEVMREGEAALRARLHAAPDLHAALTLLFEAVELHPALQSLADADELAWLAHALPPGALEAAREDDDRFFAAWLAALQARGWVREDLDPAAFLGLAGASLALVQGRALVGEARFGATRALLVEALEGALRPPPPRKG